MKKNNIKELIRVIIKETLDMMQERTLERGEWWIYPGGDVQFADGDIGDSGHEGYVIQHLTQEILEHFNIGCDNDIGMISGYEDLIKQDLIDNSELSPEEQEEWEENPSEIILKKVIEQGLYKNPEQAEDAVYIAYGSNHRDARDYAMKYLRWKRLTITSGGIYVQTWTLTPEDLRDIAHGVDDAGGDYDDPEDDSEDEQTVNIEVRSNNNIYKDIPWEVLQSKDVMRLGDYRVRQAWIHEGIFHENKEWIMYEGDNKITTLFQDNTRLSFEIKYPGGKWGEDKEKWKHKAASKWKSLAREIYNSTGLTEAGNPIVKPWKDCYKEALENPLMKEFVRRSFNPVF